MIVTQETIKRETDQANVRLTYAVKEKENNFRE